MTAGLSMILAISLSNAVLAQSSEAPTSDSGDEITDSQWIPFGQETSERAHAKQGEGPEAGRLFGQETAERARARRMQNGEDGEAVWNFGQETSERAHARREQEGVTGRDFGQETAERARALGKRKGQLETNASGQTNGRSRQLRQNRYRGRSTQSSRSFRGRGLRWQGVSGRGAGSSWRGSRSGNNSRGLSTTRAMGRGVGRGVGRGR
jgi:hypothetical protein